MAAASRNYYLIDPTHLRIHELNYELKIRKIAVDKVDTNYKRKFLRKELMKDAARPDVYVYKLEKLDFAVEKQEIEESIASITELIGNYDGNNELNKRLISRINHLRGRLDRIPGDINDEISNFRGDSLVTISVLEDDLEEAVNKYKEGEHSSSHDAAIFAGTVGGVPRSVPVYKWDVNFDGSPASGSVNSFLQRIEELRIARNCSKEELFRGAADIFKGIALEWYRSQLRQGRFQTWDTLVEALRKDFLPADYDEQLKLDIMKRTQGAHEKKSNVIQYSPKSKAEVIEVWKDITAEELAGILNKNVQYVYDIFLNQINHPHVIINDLKALQQAISRSGRKMTIIGNPKNKREKTEIKDIYPRPPPSPAQLKPRPPVVTVMGHVDHGKTTLLDALRNTNVVNQEFGGITQHIGAFCVTLKSGGCITFLDTPGHAAFSSMRRRGANITDIIVLVVAADDGVMDQTIESIKMAQRANVPILVAINKIDSPNANIHRTEEMLMEAGLQVERLGGDVQAIPISALRKQNLDQFIEALAVQADLLEIKADHDGFVEGVVIESNMHPHRGKTSTALIQRGTLKSGDILVAGTAMAKVRSMKDANSQRMELVSPGYPAEISGWRDLPAAGDQILQVQSERRAREVIDVRLAKLEVEKLKNDAKEIFVKQQQHEATYKEKLKLKRLMGRYKVRNSEPRLPQFIEDKNAPPELNIVLKADVDGSLEAILDTVDTYDSKQCKLDLVHYGVGAVTFTDIELAKSFKGIVYAFNVPTLPNIKSLADKIGVKIKEYNIIYKLIDDIKVEINERLPPLEVEEVIGEATVLQQFNINEGRQTVPVAGCHCDTGTLKKLAVFQLKRNGQIIYEGQLSSMRHLKNEVDIIKNGTDCGLQLTDKTIQFEKGDKIICIENKKVVQKIQWDPGF